MGFRSGLGFGFRLEVQLGFRLGLGFGLEVRLGFRLEGLGWGYGLGWRWGSVVP